MEKLENPVKGDTMKRNCRRDTEEKAIHEKAVRLRKMTDAQICEFIDHTYQRGFSEGAELASAQAAPSDGGASARNFIAFLESRVGSGNRIGKGTILYLNRELEVARAAGIFSGGAQ